MGASGGLKTIPVGTILFLLTSLGGNFVLGQLEDVWSGFVNVNGEDIDFLCPNNSILTGVASDFRCVQLKVPKVFGSKPNR